MRFLLALLCLATPAISQTLDQQTLEEPDRIWLRSTLHPTADLGLTVPFFPYVRFQDGTFQDRMASFPYVIAPNTCDDAYFCAEAVNDATMFDGQYALTATGMELTNVTRSALNFERAEFALAVQSDSFTRGETDVLLKLDDGALVRNTPAGPVTYVPAQADDIDAMKGLASAFEVSVARNYDCLVSGHLARAAAKDPDELSHALLATAQMGAKQMEFRDQERALRRGNTVEIVDLPQADQDALEQLTMKSVVLRMAALDMQDAYFAARDADDAAPLPPLPAIVDAVPAQLLERLAQDTLPQTMVALEAWLELSRAALPALYFHQNETTDPSIPSDLLCHSG